MDVLCSHHFGIYRNTSKAHQEFSCLHALIDNNYFPKLMKFIIINEIRAYIIH